MTSRARTDQFGEPVTEGRLPDGMRYDELSVRELVELVNREDAVVPAAVAATAPALAEAIEAIEARLARGGRLIYVGAGTSGALARLDAAECVSTFGTDTGQIAAITADTDELEDDADAGASAVTNESISNRDALVAVSASGATRFVLGAVEAALAAGTLTVALVCTEGSELAQLADREVTVVVGPEVVSGSTRLKAGTAQKLVLNTISTIAMIRLGKTYGDLMVDVAGANAKQRARARRAVRLATGAGDSEAEDALAAADGNAKVAIVSLLADVDAAAARARLEQSGGRVREALR